MLLQRVVPLPWTQAIMTVAIHPGCAINRMNSQHQRQIRIRTEYGSYSASLSATTTHIHDDAMATRVTAAVVFSAAGAAPVAAAIIRALHVPMMPKIQFAHQLPKHDALRSEAR